VTTPDHKFHRVEVVAGPRRGTSQDLVSGVQPGPHVVVDALVVDHVIAP
jgi:hypothetical protein